VEFLVKNKSLIAFITFTLFCIVSLSISTSRAIINVKEVGSSIVYPFQKGYNFAQGEVRRIWAGFTDISALREELQKTQIKVQKYESESEELSRLQIENDDLRNLLGMKYRVVCDSIPASVISKDPDNWFRTIIIDRGSEDGVMKNMPVVAFTEGQSSVVGKVVAVKSHIAKITPIISSDLKVGGMFQDSRYQGLLRGQSTNSNLSVMDYVSRSADIKYGDIVVTSGNEGIFPEGLLVGTVLKSDIQDTGNYQKAVIKPFINYDLLQEVFIIKKVPDMEFLKMLEEVQ
jgi:rod shape-determining protein MreC